MEGLLSAVGIVQADMLGSIWLTGTVSDGLKSTGGGGSGSKTWFWIVAL